MPSLKSYCKPDYDLTVEELLQNHVMMLGGTTGEKKWPRQRKGHPTHATAHLCQAVQHSLQLYGLDMRHFMADEAACRRLRIQEIRYMVDMPKASITAYVVPEDVPCKLPVVKHLGSSNKHAEVDGKVLASPSLMVFCGDESSVNLKLFHWMVGVADVKAWYIRDQAHRSWNDCKLAIQGAGLWGDFLEIMTIMGTLQGPWLSAGWYYQQLEAAKMHLSASSHQCPFFMACYDELAAELGKDSQVELHSDEGMKLIWQRLQSSGCLDNRGQRTTTTRWFQWVHSYHHYHKHYWCHFYFLLIVGHYSGLFPSVQQAPLPGDHAFFTKDDLSRKKVKKGATAASQQPAEAGSSTTMQQANAEEINKNKCKNTLHLAANLMASSGLRRRSTILLECLRLFCSVQAEEVKAAGDQSVRAKQQYSYARDKGKWVLSQSFAKLTNMSVLKSMDFELEGNGAWYKDQCKTFFGAASSSAVAPKEFCSFDLHPSDEDEEVYAMIFFKLTVKLAKQKAITMNYWSDLPPNQFILLSKASTRDQALETQRRNWACLVECEHQQHKNPALHALLQQLPWVANVGVREFMAMLAMHDFKWISPPVSQLLDAAFSGPNSTVCIEKAFNSIKNSMR